MSILLRLLGMLGVLTLLMPFASSFLQSMALAGPGGLIVLAVGAILLGTRMLGGILTAWLGRDAGSHVLALIAYNLLALPFRLLAVIFRLLFRG